MGILNKKNNNIIYTYNPLEKTPLSILIDENIAMIKKAMMGSNDTVFREFKVGGLDGKKLFLFYIDGMADKMLLNEFVIEPIMLVAREVRPDFKDIKDVLDEAIKQSSLSVTDYKEVQDVEDAIIAALSGETVLLIEGYSEALIIATRSWPTRGIGEPSSETVIRGSRDGFNETLRMNTALVRRRIRDPRFKVKQIQVGLRSKTDIALLYIEDIVDKKMLDELLSKLDQINIDAIIDSGYIEQLIEDRKFSLFPQVQVTERPDVVAASVYEGRIGIIVDNSPSVLIIPVTMSSMLQSAEDYYTKPTTATFVRFIRTFAALLSVFAPALYIAITSFHPAIIPSQLLLSIAASREGVPFPAFIEAIIMEITLELLREAGVRLPRPIGSTIGIVGGVIIGQAAVAAGIVSPIMVIIVAVTAISSFAIPSYEVSASLRIARFLLMILAAIYGLYGIVIGWIGILIHLVNIESFGVPFLSPVAPLETNDLKDGFFVKLPLSFMKKRPKTYNPNDLIRQGNNKGSKK